MRKIVVVGVGALGSHFLQFSRNLEGCSFVAVDFDRVESKNVLSQFHAKASVGKNKANALQQTMNFLYGVPVVAIPHKLTSDNPKELLGGSSLIVDCLDNGPARRIVQAFARSQGIPCLHGALSGDGTVGGAVWDNLFQIDDAPEGQATCEDGQHLPFIVMVAAQLAQSAKLYLTTGKQDSYQVFSRSPALRL